MSNSVKSIQTLKKIIFQLIC